jgi:hypothetical protein
VPTYSGWLKEQKGRTDAVGWFAKYWFSLEGRPKLSAVSSITEHLESRGLFQSVEHLTEAHDAAMHEYREVRAGVMRPVADNPGQQDTLPGMETDQPPKEGAFGIPQQSPGEIIAAATAAGVEAGKRHSYPLVDLTAGDIGNSEAILIAILKDLELVKLALGIARDEDGAVVRFPPAVTPFEHADFDWPVLYAVADHEL